MTPSIPLMLRWKSRGMKTLLMHYYLRTAKWLHSKGFQVAMLIHIRTYYTILCIGLVMRR